ncbi:acyl-CoA carboxylase subunit beta [Corynebacterium sp. TAE3-ERU12]|uniref:acyl-CoA carboxylase subunit beta n=1 Tax=Corynebacterium sp. TAE3-ERU12 TaxID=2849491 RepID=UPI001C47CAED|nr:acyl-CoA carboxylase subunit beta [Corynebacterium sp. TAE3-ERU12]MBV7295185.1 acyl-CoA carboxylase subunit beta [Corynebacterium sp. TAE3-ERU12]
MTKSSSEKNVVQEDEVKRVTARVLNAQRLDYDRLHHERNRVIEDRAQARNSASVLSRISALVDAGTFQEHWEFLGYTPNQHEQLPAIITGLGKIHGRDVAVYAQYDSGGAGALGAVEATKMLRLFELAERQRIPIVGIINSAGARIQEGVSALSSYSRIFHKTAALSGTVPQVSIIVGACAGGAVYGPAMTDCVVMVAESSFMFVTGPSVVRAEIGETVDALELGGAEVHATKSGLCDYMAADEEDAFEYCRCFLSYLPDSCGSYPRNFNSFESEVVPQRLPSEVVPADFRESYDVRDLVRSLVDYGEFLEVKQNYARSLSTGFACLGGFPVGIVANNPRYYAGTLDSESSEKGAAFVQLCDAFNVPIVSLVDVPGYLPGKDVEAGGIIRRGSKLLFSYARASCHLLTVVVRKGYGGAFDVLGSKALGADRVLAWPTAQVAVMGANGAVDILYRRRLASIDDADERSRVREELRKEYEKEVMNVHRAVSEGDIDDVIAPDATRDRLIEELHRWHASRPQPSSSPKHGNFPA